MTTNSTKYMRNYIEKWQQHVLYQLGEKCLICSSRKNLEVHHIFGYTGNSKRGRGKLVRITDWLRYIDKLALLCHHHHNEYHNFCQGEINKETLLDYILYKYIEHTEWSNK